MLPQIQRFAEGMQYKIDKNMHKSGWLTYNDKGERVLNYEMVAFLTKKLEEEMQELIEASKILVNDEDKSSLFFEACDVGNIAMMIADACGAIKDSIPGFDMCIVEQWAHAEIEDDRYFRSEILYPSSYGSLMRGYLHALIMVRDLPANGCVMLEASSDGKMWVDITRQGARIEWQPLCRNTFFGSIYERALFGSIPNPFEPIIGTVGHDIMTKGEYMFDSVEYDLIRIRTLLPTPGKMHIDVARAVRQADFWRILCEKCTPA